MSLSRALAFGAACLILLGCRSINAISFKPWIEVELGILTITADDIAFNLSSRDTVFVSDIALNITALKVTSDTNRAQNLRLAAGNADLSARLALLEERVFGGSAIPQNCNNNMNTPPQALVPCVNSSAPVPSTTPITTHILDTARGKPAQGVPMTLTFNNGSAWTTVGNG